MTAPDPDPSGGAGRPGDVDPLSLDRTVGQRQAFGKHAERPTHAAQQTQRILGGELALPPHPVWNGDLHDWSADPFGDRNWQFQFHALRWLNPVRWQGLDGDAQAQRFWLDTVRSWARANIPASRAPSSFAWVDMADGLRAVELSLGAVLVPDDQEHWFRTALEYHRDWLSEEQHLVGGNHGLFQHLGLLLSASVLRDGAGQQLARDRLEAQLRDAFDAQGVNEEGSAAYHQSNLVWWTQAVARLQAEGLALGDDAAHRLERAGAVLAQLSMPFGYLPQIGDSVRAKVRTGLHPHADFAATLGKKGTRPDQRRLHASRGLTVLRSGWGQHRALNRETQVVVRHGAELHRHSHQDRLSIHYASDGLRWLVDGGFHSYQHHDPVRDFLRSRSAHNVPYFRELPYRSPGEVPVVAARFSDDVDELVLIDDGHTAGLIQRRIVYCPGPDCLVVIDQGRAAVSTALVQPWLVEIGVDVEVQPNAVVLRGTVNRRTPGVRMQWLRPVELHAHRAVESDLRGWVGTAWKTQEPGTLVTASASGWEPTLPVVIAPELEAPLEITTHDALALELRRGDRRWRLSLDEGGAQLECS
ncbi:MAG: heparinase II/III domain-containing protein [Micrococcaceae bacterium]